MLPQGETWSAGQSSSLTETGWERDSGELRPAVWEGMEGISRTDCPAFLVPAVFLELVFYLIVQVVRKGEQALPIFPRRDRPGSPFAKPPSVLVQSG